MRNQKGFTLVEVMIVVAILGIITAIAITSLTKVRVKAFNASATTEVRNMLTFESAFYNENYQFVPVALADKNGVGQVAITVATASGNVTFNANGLSVNNELICKVDATKTHLVIAARHTSGSWVVGTDSDFPAFKFNAQTTTLQASDVPNSTTGDDLTSWTTIP